MLSLQILDRDVVKREMYLAVILKLPLVNRARACLAS